MRLPSSTPPPPKLELSGISTTTEAQKTLDPEREDELWQRQQTILAGHREDFVFTVESNKSGNATANEVREVVDRMAGKVHVTGWENLAATFDSLGKLGDEFHEAIFVLGGWHHKGDLAKLAKPTQSLLEQLRDYRVMLWADELRNRVVKAGAENKVVAQAKLTSYLQEWVKLFPPGVASMPNELQRAIWLRQTALTLSIETELLFLQNRVFLFTPSPKKPTAGWQDFNRFVYAYSRLKRKFKNEYNPFYWGIFLPKR